MEWWVPGVWGRGDRELVFKGYSISVWDDKNVLEIDNSNGFTTLQMHGMPQNYTLMNGYNGKFYIMHSLHQV